MASMSLTEYLLFAELEQFTHVLITRTIITFIPIFSAHCYESLRVKNLALCKSKHYVPLFCMQIDLKQHATVW